jgi:hypothetical protein
VCGTRRQHVYDPAARFLSAATSRSRATLAKSTRSSRGPSLATAVLLALIPLAVAVGLLLGRSSSGQDGKLLAALRAQRPQVINVGSGPGPRSTAGATPASLSSDFTLARGYAVELKTLPAGSTQSAATTAEDSVRAKGATGVGLISLSSFIVTPKPASGADVIYSGQFKTRAEAERALARLKKSFPSALVISVVERVGVGASGAVLSETVYGTFHSVAGIKPPTRTQLAQGAQVTKKVASEINNNYVQSQKHLPNVISVP